MEINTTDHYRQLCAKYNYDEATALLEDHCDMVRQVESLAQRIDNLSGRLARVEQLLDLPVLAATPSETPIAATAASELTLTDADMAWVSHRDLPRGL